MKQGKPVDFTGVDLTRPADEIANELNCSLSAVYLARCRRGIKAYPFKKVSLDGVDLTRPAYLIAKDLGVSTCSILRRMRLLGLPIRKVGGWFKRASKFDGTAFDWSKRDSELAPDYPCTREYIRQLRKKAGEPASGSREWEDKYHPVKTSQQPDT